MVKYLLSPGQEAAVGKTGFAARKVARFSMMTTSWCCDECDVSNETELEHRHGAAASPGF
jgi:hypothetical protein